MALGEPQLQSVEVQVTTRIRERLGRMTIVEAARILDVTERVVRYWVRDGMPTNGGEGAMTVDLVTVLDWYTKRCVSKHAARGPRRKVVCPTCGR